MTVTSRKAATGRSSTRATNGSTRSSSSSRPRPWSRPTTSAATRVRRKAEAPGSATSVLRPRSESSAPLLDVDVGPLHRTGVELTRAADLHRGIADHLLPVRHPTRGARDRKHHREHRTRDPERAVDDARIEIDVRIQLATDEVVVLERDLLEPQGQLEQR